MPVNDVRSIASAKWRPTVLLALLTFNFGVVFLDRNALSFLIPWVAAELALSNARVGLLSAVTALAWAIGGLLLTVSLVRRLSSRQALLGLCVLTAISALVTGLAHAFMLLLLVRAAAGLFGGPVMPLSQALTASAAGQRHRGLHMGIVQSLGASVIGTVLGPLALIGVALHWGWRAAFYAVAAVGFLSASLMGQFLRIPPSAERLEGHALAPRPAAARQQLWQQPNLRRCAFISVAMVGWLLTSVTFLPLYLVRELRISTAQMGTLMATFGAAGACGGVLLPHLSDYIGRGRAVCAGALLAAAAPLVLLFSAHSVLVLGLIIFGSALGSGTIPLFMGTIPAESLPPEQVHAAMGWVQGLGESLGGVLMPLLCGLLADRFGLRTMLWVLIACALTAAIAAVGLAEPVLQPRMGNRPVPAGGSIS